MNNEKVSIYWPFLLSLNDRFTQSDTMKIRFTRDQSFV